MAFSVNNAPLAIGANVTPLNTPLENQIGMVKLQQVKQLAIDQEKQRQTAAAFQQALRSTSGDYDAAASMLDKQGYDTLGLRNSLADYRDKLQKGATAHIDQMKKEHDMMSSLFADVDSPEKFSAALPIANRIDPEFVKMLGPNPTYNPQTIDAIKNVGISAADHLKMAEDATKSFATGDKAHGLALAVAGTTNDEDLQGALQYAQVNGAPAYLLQKYQGVKWSPELVAAAKTEAIGPEKQAELDAKANAPDKVQSAEIEAIKAFTEAHGRKPTEAELDGIHKRFKEAGTVVRVSTGTGGPGAGGLTAGEGGGLELAGTMTRLLGRIPVGMARGGNTAAIMNEAAKQNKLIGQTPVAMMQKAAVYASDKKALDNLTKQSSAAEAYENKAQAQLDIVDGLSDKVKRTSIPLLNRAILAGETSIMGDPDATLLLNAIQTASAEYAKIMMGGTASAAALTDSAQKEAQKLLSASMNPTTLRKATQLMRTEMGLTMQGYDAAKQHISTSLGGGAAQTTAPAQNGPKVGERRNFNGKIGEWDGTGWKPVSNP